MQLELEEEGGDTPGDGALPCVLAVIAALALVGWLLSS
jgi:hypothetical protein